MPDEKQAEHSANIKDDVVASALRQAELLGWEYVTLPDIADDAGISLAQLHDHFEDKFDILAAIGRKIDRKVLANMDKPDPEMSERERLFDLLMDRFEVLNEDRAGLAAIVRSFKADPKQAVVSAPHLCRSMCWMLETCGISTSGFRGMFKVAGLSGLYLKLLRVWIHDESADLGETMAALDKALGRAESVANTLGF